MPQLIARRASRRPSASRALDFVAVAFATELGWMALAQHDEVLAGVVFGCASKRQATQSLRQNLAWGAGRLGACAPGEDVVFGAGAVDEQHLTDFGRRIVKACRRIPRGRTRSYG